MFSPNKQELDNVFLFEGFDVFLKLFSGKKIVEQSTVYRLKTFWMSLKSGFNNWEKSTANLKIKIGRNCWVN